MTLSVWDIGVEAGSRSLMAEEFIKMKKAEEDNKRRERNNFLNPDGTLKRDVGSIWNSVLD